MSFLADFAAYVILFIIAALFVGWDALCVGFKDWWWKAKLRWKVAAWKRGKR